MTSSFASRVLSLGSLAAAIASLLVGCGPATSTSSGTESGTGSGWSSGEPAGSSSSSSAEATAETGESASTTSGSAGSSGSTGTSESGSSSGSGDSSGSTGGESSGSTGGESGSTGGESVLPEDADADAVPWPASCLPIASEDVVCLTFGLDGFEKNLGLYAVSLESGASCELADVEGIDSFDAPDTLAWIGPEVAWPGGFESAGRRLDLETGVLSPLDASEVRFAEYDGGVFETGGGNWPFYADLDALEAGLPSETYAVGLSGRPVVVSDTVYTFDYDGDPAGGYSLLDQASVPGLFLDLDGNIDGIATLTSTFAVLVDDTIHVFDDDGMLVQSQPLAVDGARGLACSRGLTG